MQAVVLAAGKGVRLKPLTDSIPKCMIKVLGKPILERLLEQLSKAGVKEVHLVVGYKKEVIEEKFREEFLGMKLNYFVQEKQLGTGHALSLVEDFVKGNFFVLNSDILVEQDIFRELSKLDEFDESDAKLVTVEVKDPWRYGCLELKGDTVKDIIEKPAPGQEPSKNVNIGVYVFDKLVFAALKETEPSIRNEFELVDAIKQLIKAGGVVKAVKYKGFYSHIGEEKDILETEKVLNNSKA